MENNDDLKPVRWAGYDRAHPHRHVEITAITWDEARSEAARRLGLYGDRARYAWAAVVWSGETPGAAAARSEKWLVKGKP